MTKNQDLTLKESIQAQDHKIQEFQDLITTQIPQINSQLTEQAKAFAERENRLTSQFGEMMGFMKKGGNDVKEKEIAPVKNFQFSSTAATVKGAKNVDYRIDSNVNGDLVGNSVEVGDRARDEDEICGTSVDVTFQEDQDNKVDPDSLAQESIPEGIPSAPLVPADEPYEGQEFESEAAAHAFYNGYATRVGFVIRVSKLSRSRRDGSAIGRALVCNKEGYRLPDKREKIVRQRAETRVGCRAMILVRKVISGKWVVTKFVKEHTHPLTPGKGRKDCIYDQYPNEHDKIRELSLQLANEKKRAATYKRHLELIFEQIEEHNESLAKKVQHIVDSMKDIEDKEQKSCT